VKVRRVTISGFRGVRSGKVLLDSHSLLVAVNAAGKSTVCEALDLALGLERLSRHPVIDEYDFYEARYRVWPGRAPPLPNSPADRIQLSRVRGPGLRRAIAERRASAA
jgi:putative ATP-dependent endonuclease of the OLD family